MFQLRIGPPSPPVLCPHEPYTDLVAGLCQNGEPTLTCTPLTGATSTLGSDASGNCTGTVPSSSAAQHGSVYSCRRHFNVGGSHTCTYPATQTSPPPEGSTQTTTIVNKRCTIIQPGPT